MFTILSLFQFVVQSFPLSFPAWGGGYRRVWCCWVRVGGKDGSGLDSTRLGLVGRFIL